MMQNSSSTATAERALPEAGAIDYRTSPPRSVFTRSYLRPLRPVVINDAAPAWRAYERWTPDFFKESYPDKQITVGGTTYRLADFVDLVERSDGKEETPYLFALLLDEHFPDLMADIEPPSPYVSPNWLERQFLPGNVGRRLYSDRRFGLFIGGRGSGASLHYDFGYHSLSFQFFGEKRLYLYPPEQTPLMYARPGHRVVSEIGDVERVDLAKHPLFADARPLTCVLRPGEILFIPGGWWHATRVLSPSVSLSVNTADGANWPLVVRRLYEEMRPKHPILATPFALFLRAVGVVKSLKDWAQRAG